MAGSAALAAASLLDTAPSRGQALSMASPAGDTAPQGTNPSWRCDAIALAAAIAARRVSNWEATMICMERLGAIDPRINAVVEPWLPPATPLLQSTRPNVPAARRS